MKHRACIAAFAGLFCAAVAIAQDQPRPTTPPQTPPQPDRAQPDRAQPERSQPGAEHRNFEALVGNWEVTGQCWCDKTAGTVAAQPHPCMGTVKSEWVLGNRFVKCHIRATDGDQQFEGMGLMGYDPAKSKYVSSFADSECPSIKSEEGTYDPSAKTFTFMGESKGPDGKLVKCRRTMKIVSNDEHVMTAYVTFEGKGEQKMAELTFKRSTKSAAVTP